MMTKILLILSAICSVSAKAQTASYPPPSKDVADLKTSITQHIGIINRMGQLCDGGARKWVKIEQLQLLYAESETYKRIQGDIANLSQECARVATSSGRMDPDGTQLVIPQRIMRSREIFPEDKRTCLQFWADWFDFEKIGNEQVLPLRQRFSNECKGTSAPAVTGTPATESPANR